MLLHTLRASVAMQLQKLAMELGHGIANSHDCSSCACACTPHQEYLLASNMSAANFPCSKFLAHGTCFLGSVD
jgi:hypothetical protein